MWHVAWWLFIVSAVVELIFCHVFDLFNSIMTNETIVIIVVCNIDYIFRKKNRWNFSFEAPKWCQSKKSMGCIADGVLTHNTLINDSKIQWIMNDPIDTWHLNKLRIVIGLNLTTQNLLQQKVKEKRRHLFLDKIYDIYLIIVKWKRTYSM